MKTIAMFSPFGPLPSGVAVYAERLAAELAREWELVFYIDDGYEPGAIKNIGAVKNHKEFRGREDLFLYQVSNGPMHSYIYPHLLEYGGAITLHDSTLYDMVMNYWNDKPRARFWIDFFRNESVRGLKNALAPLPDGNGNFSARILHNLYYNDRKRYSFRFFKRIMKRTNAIAAHSKTAIAEAVKYGGHFKAMTVPLAVESLPEPISKSDARRFIGSDKINIGEKSFVACAYGYIQPHKRIEPILDAWAQLVVETPDSKLLLVGPRSPDLDIDKAVEKRKLAEKVFIDDSFAPIEKIYKYIFSADFCLNLRNPVYGSTSQTLMEILSTGRACAVTDLETFSEFDDGVVKKLKPENEVEEILKALRWARDNVDEREKMGERARSYVRSECLWSEVGKKYNEFLSALLK